MSPWLAMAAPRETLAHHSAPELEWSTAGFAPAVWNWNIFAASSSRGLVGDASAGSQKEPEASGHAARWHSARKDWMSSSRMKLFHSRKSSMIVAVDEPAMRPLESMTTEKSSSSDSVILEAATRA